jgi:hypothetical protein
MPLHIDHKVACLTTLCIVILVALSLIYAKVNNSHKLIILAIVDYISENMKEFRCCLSLLQSNLQFAHHFHRFFIVNTRPSPTNSIDSHHHEPFNRQHNLPPHLVDHMPNHQYYVLRRVHLQSRRILWDVNPIQINLHCRTPPVILDRYRAHVSFEPLRVSPNNVSSLAFFR